jgi:HD-GYP domain-containing protein (c-di-GMP phosphodiesterase class II)
LGSLQDWNKLNRLIFQESLVADCVRYAQMKPEMWTSTAMSRPNTAGALLGELIRTSPASLRAHHERVSAMGTTLASLAGIEEERALLIGIAGWLHDIGMVLVPREILDRRGVIGRDDRDTIRNHCRWGHEILTMTEDPELRIAALVALQHHERWDGSGYPSRLCATEISIEARIIGLCSVYDALRRPSHKDPIGHDEAIEILQERNPKTRLPGFDPDLTGLFVANAAVFRRIVEDGVPAIVIRNGDGVADCVSRH